MATRLRDLVSVAPRYARAINLERDAGSEAGLHGYVITKTAHAFLSRLAQAFTDRGRHRAWTLTGPYGSGKSAFLLFLSALLGPGTTASGRFARRLLKQQHADLAQELASTRALARDGFCPILVSGSPGSIVHAVLQAAARDLRPLYSVGRPSAAYRNLELLAKRGTREVTPKEVVSALSEVTQSLREAGKARGVLVVVDELGKFLEHAAQTGEADDVFLLQELAEATAKSQDPSILLVTVLHQAFEQYASALRPRDRQEWEKIQGRFEDFAFQEPPDQILYLIGQALRHAETSDMRKLRLLARRQAEGAVELGLVPSGLTEKEFIATLEDCAPLHPLVVLCLARLCRKFGQNHRSLFSFLTSREPHGLGTFLDTADEVGESCYRVAELHDYVAEAFGSALSVGEGAGRWAEVQASLDRASLLPQQEIRLVKTIGVLSAAGPHGNLKASVPILEFAEVNSRQNVKRSLSNLLSQSIAVERKHSGTIALWEGSDVDLDERVREAERRLPSTGSLAQRANEQWRPRPLVAKRHSYRTGTLRYFDAVFVDLSTFTTLLNERREADGVVLFTLPSDSIERDELLTLASTSEARDRLEAVVAVPQDSDALLDAVRNLELLRWVEAHTPELQSDAVARRELRARIILAESRVAMEARRLFSPDEHLARGTKWFHHGIEKPITSGRTLAEFLSGVCDSIYPNTPVLKNELVNRRLLSSAASAARRNVIDGMIRRPTVPRLGFEGTPPEVSIYASVLGQTGIHRQQGSEWELGAPSSNPELLVVWQRIERFFDECELERRAVTELFGVLQRPPFGLKMGVIPVLFCAAFLAHDTEVALYEEGAFLPELTIEAFERLLRSPEKFSLRRYRVEGVRREVFRRLAQLFGSEPDPHVNLVTVIRPLYKFFAKLPAYSQKTNSVSPTAVAVREALLTAKEPDKLLFDSLPRACAIDSLPANDGDAEAVRTFIHTLQQCLLELQRTYDDLLANLRSLLLRAFSLSEEARSELQTRATGLLPHCIDGRLKAFVQQLQDADLNDSSSIEALAAILVGKPPKTWTDVDRARYEVALAEMTRAFRHLEALVFEESRRTQAGGKPTQIFRVGVSDRHSRDYETVVSIEGRDESRLAEAVIGLRATLEAAGLIDNSQLALAALAMLCREFLADLDERPIAPRRAHHEVTNGH